MANKSESRIRTVIAEFLRSEGGFVIVTSGSIKTAQGTPDILATYWGNKCGRWHHLAIEVKTPEGSPSELQIATLRLMGLKGYMPMIVTSVQETHRLAQLFDLRRSKSLSHVATVQSFQDADPYTTRIYR